MPLEPVRQHTTDGSLDQGDEGGVFGLLLLWICACIVAVGVALSDGVETRWRGSDLVPSGTEGVKRIHDAEERVSERV
jgi:hypothetical protein